METIGNGILLADVRHGLFIDKLGTITTIAKIIKNGIAFNLGTGSGGTSENGSISVGGDYLSWVFNAPNDRFDFDALGSGTVEQLLDGIISVCETDPVYEWEAYATWCQDPGVVQAINSIGVDLAWISVLGYTGVPTMFYAPTNFADILRWVKSNCPAEALALPASLCRTAENEYSVELNGLNIDGAVIWMMTFVFRQ